ncbi:LysM peptidoglycan-binding domain-containing protein [Nocardioides jensenii]|uniref:LysM peptidoglycan-binding domain-containing protein n=1 Tax=Nocardioides jensenii TaxID=1843 RepID=UPI00082C63BD|nr:LysM peptidoglycan-binding domain-containing protein [Nocardioides jensenii]
MTRINPRIRGLAAFVLILVVLIGTPMLLIFIGATPWNVDWSQLRMLLLSPDDGTVALILIGIVAWLAWAVMTFCLISEVIATVRGVRAPRLPVIGTGQHLAAQLVAAAALLFTVAQPLAITFAAVPAHAQDQTPHDVRPAQAPAAQSVPSAETSRTVVAEQVEPAPVSYTTRPHDSLWKIAETHLGDGARFSEIVALNPGQFPNGPKFLATSVVLQLPAPTTDPVDPTPDADARYVVEEGDTLWDIADEELGDPMRYGEIFDASRTTTQPDGARLTDPDLIRPGWELDIPNGTAPEASPGQEIEPPAIPEEPPVVEPPTVEPTQPEASAEPQPNSDDTHAAADGTASETPGWLLPGLAGAGSVLAGSLFLVLRGHRRRQMRYRYPGEVLEAPPQELADVEKSARHAESATVPRIEDLDRLLRHFAEGLELTGQPLPRLQTVEMASDLVTLHLAEEAPAPPGWTEHGSSWSFTIEQRLPESDRPAPFPLLAAVGQTSSGHLVLTNLEEFGCVRIAGDDTAAKALARSITAELTLSPWSVLADIDTIGIADELADLDPVRLHHHTSDDTAFLTQMVEELVQQGDREPETFHAVVTVSAVGADQLAQSIAARHDRVGAALVTVGGHERAHDIAFHLSDGGRLLIPDLDLNLSPAGLTEAEATATAELVSATRDAVTVPSPPNRTSEPAWRSATDRSGSLTMVCADAFPDPGEARTVEELVSPPAAAVDEEVNEPNPDPIAPTMTIAEPLDPELDADVKAWFDDDCRLPRLHLLGPVRAQAHGDPAAVSRRKPHYVEMLAFLALHPEGVTTKQIAEAFSVNKDRVRVDITMVRKWLGRNERTGQPHLPAAAQSRAAGEAGVWTYQVDDVLVDADLFRRLRARGQSRGIDGHDDFDTALRLVGGAPFSDLRESGWSWLLDSDSRDDEILACAIVDVAHDVVTAALADGDLDRALHAVETARIAAPYDEVARVDLAAVLVAQGHEDAAREFLTNAVHNRTDDHLGPIDLPARTVAQLRRSTPPD